MKKIYLLVLTLVSTLSFGQVILNEPLNYVDNTTLISNGWVVNSAGLNAMDVGASNGLSYTGYNDGAASITGATPGNAARVDNTGQDDGRTFTAVTTGQIYYSFLLNVTNATAGYAISLGASGTTFASRVFVKPSTINAGTHFNIGLSNTGTASFAATPTEFLLGTTYLIIVKYDVNATGAGSIWVKSTGLPMTEAAAGTPEHTTSASGQASIDRFCLRQFNASQNQTVDAIFVASTWLGTAACALSLGAETTTCDAVTLSLDTYNVSIPFTGGGSGSYTLSTSAGTIAGDDPNLVATGNITISGISEGTGANFNITGTCSLSKTIISPSCKPINPLPLNEPFNYTTGNTLSNEQMWANVNTGDNILVATGNLTYSGITPTGNSVTFVGTGAESKTPFTDTTSGTIYASFLASVTDLSNVTADLTPTYFAALLDGTGSVTVARLWIRNNAGQYQYGLSPTAFVADIVWSPTLYNTASTQYLIFGYNFTANTLALYENPAIPSTATASVGVTPTTALTSIGGFLLRQDGAATTPTVIVDELYIDTAIPNITLSRNDFNAIAGLRIYPNPAKNVLNITSDSFAPKNVEIYNVVGAKVLATQVTNSPVNVAGLTTGIYMVKVTEDGKTATRKLVIE